MNDTPRLPSRVLMTTDAVGGVWPYALELAELLAPKGIEIALAQMGPPASPAQRADAARLPNVTLHESRYALEWMDHPWADVDAAGAWLLGLASDFRPDLIHLNGFAHATLPWGVPVMAVVHTCVLSWWAAVRGGEIPAAYDEYRRRVAAGLAAADLVVAPTDAVHQMMAAHYPAPRRRMTVHNARDARHFSPAAEKQPKIFTAGRAWDPAKNLRLLDEAAAYVRWPVEMAGDCDQPNGAGEVFENVQCLGLIGGAEVARHFAESAIFALPARYEPFGLSALEAGLSGCALVLGDIPSLREVWGDAAVFVPPDDVGELATALNAMCDDAGRVADYGRRARVRALEYSPQRMTAGYLAAYRACLGD